MAAQKETIMVLKVDLDCPCCYKKVKKLLCSTPQIRDQTYNEKQNMVMIKVLCCCPHKLMDKLRRKGGKSIKDIQIHKPPEPKPKPESEPKPEPKPKPVQPNPNPTQPVHPSRPPRQRVVETTNPGPVVPNLGPQNPTTSCCSDCYEGRRSGPCYHRHGYGYGCVVGTSTPPPPPCGWSYYYYGGCPYPSRGVTPIYCVCSCCDYVSHDNPTAWATM